MTPDAALTGPDWIEWGGRLFAVDFTPGGAPIGLDAEEFEAVGDENRGLDRAEARDENHGLEMPK